VMATPNAGYALLNWTEGASVVSSSASYNFTASGNRTLVANFVLAQAPPLTISLTTTNALLVSWPWPSTGYKLQQNVAVGTTNWTDATNTVDVVVDRNQVIVAPLTGQGFFRLFHP